MSKMKNYMMDIEEFCDDYLHAMHAGAPYGVTPSAEEVAADAESHFNSKMAGDYAEEYVTKTLGSL
jgi:hypothetical protein